MINFNTGVCIKQIFVEGGGGVHPIVFSWSDCIFLGLIDI